MVPQRPRIGNRAAPSFGATFSAQGSRRRPLKGPRALRDPRGSQGDLLLIASGAVGPCCVFLAHNPTDPDGFLEDLPP